MLMFGLKRVEKLPETTSQLTPINFSNSRALKPELLHDAIQYGWIQGNLSWLFFWAHPHTAAVTFWEYSNVGFHCSCDNYTQGYSKSVMLMRSRSNTWARDGCSNFLTVKQWTNHQLFIICSLVFKGWQSVNLINCHASTRKWFLFRRQENTDIGQS